jgi:hypothetical protein
MIILTSTDTLRITLLAAQTSAPVRLVCAYRDIGAASFAPGRAVANSNGTTPVDVVGSPASGVQRFLDAVNLLNADTVNQTVTVAYRASGTDYILTRVTLGPNERLAYGRDGEWRAYNAAGAAKSIATGTQNVVASGLSVAVLASDVTNNNATLNTIQDVTGLSFPVVALQRYWFRFCIPYTAAATTTGSRWTINGPAQNELRYNSEYSLTTTSRTFNEGLTAYDSPAASNASSATTGSNMAIIEGFIRPTADGDVIARFASEIANSAIIARTGAYVEYMAL